MPKPGRRQRKSRKHKEYLIVVALIVVAVAFYLYYSSTSLFNVPVVKAMSGTYTLNDVVEVNGNVVAFAGSSQSNNISYGVAGEFFIQNSSYSFFNLGDYFQNGTIYSIAYNGSAFLLAGAQYIREGNVSVLQPEVALYADGKAINVSQLIPSFYTPGQAYVAAWTGKYWLVGGSALVIEGTAQYNVPFLVKVFPNLTSVDLTSRLPAFFYSPLSVGTGVYALSSQGGQFAVGGSHLFNYTFAVFNGTSFVDSLDGVGLILTVANSPDGWLIGGFNYSSKPDVTLTLLGIVNGSGVHFIDLKYAVGVVVAVGYGDGEYVVSVRIPLINEASGTVSEEGIVLMGKTPTSLSEVYAGINVSVNSLALAGDHVVGVGYKVSNQVREGIIIVLRVT
ncbi:MAG: hypothetical protein TQ35_0009350 [Candidatus Aramenus sulfurataquae]|jgi:hypothetical protein|uniref:Uncharacterized protein n=2 Tax=Candidatus Aramenus sulfurataquae TaxID=1326980 RepID=A0A0F2LSH4_9CREN